jgi:hypothetical protein
MAIIPNASTGNILEFARKKSDILNAQSQYYLNRKTGYEMYR